MTTLCSAAACKRKGAKPDEDFFRNGKFWKTCNDCSEAKKKYYYPERVAKWKKDNREHYNAQERARYAADPNIKSKQRIKSKKYWIARCVRSARLNDEERGWKTEYVDFITKDFVRKIWKCQNGKCHYCGSKCSPTIERLDNEFPHTKVNCVIACKSCNSKHNY